jgi:hypothetical protein
MLLLIEQLDGSVENGKLDMVLAPELRKIMNSAVCF